MEPIIIKTDSGFTIPCRRIFGEGMQLAHEKDLRFMHHVKELVLGRGMGVNEYYKEVSDMVNTLNSMGIKWVVTNEEIVDPKIMETATIMRFFVFNKDDAVMLKLAGHCD